MIEIPICLDNLSYEVYKNLERGIRGLIKEATSELLSKNDFVKNKVNEICLDGVGADFQSKLNASLIEAKVNTEFYHKQRIDGLEQKLEQLAANMDALFLMANQKHE